MESNLGDPHETLESEPLHSLDRRNLNYNPYGPPHYPNRHTGWHHQQPPRYGAHQTGYIPNHSQIKDSNYINNPYGDGFENLSRLKSSVSFDPEKASGSENKICLDFYIGSIFRIIP